MSNVSFGNLSTNSQINPEFQKRLESQENFGAIDTEKLKQDTVEIASKATEQVKENFIFRTLRNVFGVKDPKKFLTSLGLTTIVVTSFALLGNRGNNKVLELTKKIDNSDFFKNLDKKTGKIKKTASNFLDKFEITGKIKDTLKNRKTSPVQSLARTIGPKSQFAFNVVDVIQAMHFRAVSEFGTLRKAFGGLIPGAKKNALEFLKNIEINKRAQEEVLNQIKPQGVNDKKLQELVEICSSKKAPNFLQTLLGKDPQVQALLPELQKLGLDETTSGKLIAEIKKMSEFDKGFTKLKGKLGEKEATELIGKLTKENDDFKKFVQKTIGAQDNDPELQYFIDNFLDINTDGDKNHFVKMLTERIAKTNGLDPKSDNYAEELEKLLRNMSKEKNFSGITMNREGFFQGWTFANAVDWTGSRLFKNNWKPFGKGNLGDALLKYNMVDGKLAKTGTGRLVQKTHLYTTESISNHVADLGAINMFITLPMMLDLFNNTQDAPKEQKVATLADEFVGGLGSFVISMPLASALTYGLASMKNLKGVSKLNPLKLAGEIVGMGLDMHGKAKGGAIPRFVGGALRLWLIMFFLNGKISGAIQKGVQKIFGKPYNKEEAEKLKLEEEQKKQIIPELGITQGELIEKMQNNPLAVQRLQTDAKLANEVAKNPKLILDLLDGKEIKITQTQVTKDNLSPANKKLLERQGLNSTNMNNQTNVSPSNATKNEQIATSTNHDSATYIPSSDFIAKASSLSPEQQSEYDKIMQNADRALANAEKYI